MSLRRIAAPCAVAAATWHVWVWWQDRIRFGADAAWGLLPFALAFLSLTTATRLAAATRADLRPAAAALVGYAALAPWAPPSVAAWFAFAALFAATCAAVGRRAAPPAFGLLFLALPVVPQLDFFAGYPLRAATTVVAQGVLGAAREGFVRAGATLVRDGRVFAVDTPCSGVKSLWTALLLAAALAAFLRLPLRRSLPLALVAVAATVVGNGMRTAAIVLAESHGRTLGDTAHAAVGVVSFGGVAALLCALATRGAARTATGGVRCAAA
jgi:exosortase/archaeosortase family protein